MVDNKDRMLVAFDGSPASLRAARLAFDLAGQIGGTVRLLAVLTDDEAGRLIDRFGPGHGTARERRKKDLSSGIDYAVRIGQDLGLAVESVVRTAANAAEPFDKILSEADGWGAGWIFMGRTSTRGPRRALLGSQTSHVLEFSRIPVVVVPAGPVDPVRGRGQEQS